MNPGRFFIPNMAMNPMMMRNAYMAPRSAGLLSRITGGLRSFNWSKLLNGANKTLNVMNQTIPLIRQTKPMIGNVKSMLQLAKAFRSETNNNYSINRGTTPNRQYSNKGNNNGNHDEDYPTFFI